MPHPHRRRCTLGRMLTAAAGLSMGALLWSAAARSQLHAPLPLAGSWSLQQQDRSFAPLPELLRSPPPEFLLSPSPARARPPAHRRRKAPRRLLPPRAQSTPTPQHQEQVDAVLLPDREVLLLSAEPASAKGATCAFQGGASSPARALGRLPGPGRHAYLCLLPDSAQQPIQPPLLVSSSSAAAAPRAPAPAAGKLLNWNDTMVFDSALLQGGDVLVFAKGPSHRKGVIRTATADVQCIYRGGARGTEASFPAIASAQQAFRMGGMVLPGAEVKVTTMQEVTARWFGFGFRGRVSEAEFQGLVLWALVAAVAEYRYFDPTIKELQTRAKRTSTLLVFPGYMAGTCSSGLARCSFLIASMDDNKLYAI